MKYYSSVEFGSCEKCGCKISFKKLARGGYLRHKYCDECRRGKPRDYASRARYLTSKVTEHRRKRKKMSVDYLGGKCSVCGYDKCVNALVFHHTDPLKKKFRISGKMVSWEKMKKELDKCILLCSNCHAEIHEV